MAIDPDLLRRAVEAIERARETALPGLKTKLSDMEIVGIVTPLVAEAMSAKLNRTKFDLTDPPWQTMLLAIKIVRETGGLE